MILFFFGPPGAGKGTQAKLISQKLKIVHLSTGEVLRSQLKKENKLSFQLKKILESGQLVSDKILNKIVSERIKLQDCKKGFIFDGYPRTISQAYFINDYFTNNNLSIDHFFEFNVNFDLIVARIINRSLVESREDDNKEVIMKRIEKYKQETKPVLDYYKRKFSSIYHIVDGSQEIENINSIIIKIIEKR